MAPPLRTPVRFVRFVRMPNVRTVAQALLGCTVCLVLVVTMAPGSADFWTAMVGRLTEASERIDPREALCLRENGSLPCRCLWNQKGKDCTFECFNECNLRGECINGLCICRDNYFGIDCSLRMGLENRPEIIPHPRLLWPDSIAPRDSAGTVRPLLYVYDLPPHILTKQYRKVPSSDQWETILFLERLLVSPHRTVNPDEADFFYLPLIVGDHALLEDSLHHVKDSWREIWDRKEGRDHIVTLPGQWGGCQVSDSGGRSSGLREVLLGEIILVTKWGYTHNMMTGRERPCFQFGKDIVIPPILPGKVLEYSPFLRGKRRERERDTLLFFEEWEGFEKAEDPASVPPIWSFGIVQRMREIYGGREKEAGVKLVREGKGSKPYLEEMANSVFCLAPSGYGFGVRTTEAILVGCVPVVIQPDVVQPLEGDLLQWTSFAVFLKQSQISRLPEILGSISSAEIANFRKEGANVWSRFIWASPQMTEYIGGMKSTNYFAENDAFSSVMAILRKRLQVESVESSGLGGDSINISSSISFGAAVIEGGNREMSQPSSLQESGDGKEETEEDKIEGKEEEERGNRKAENNEGLMGSESVVSEIKEDNTRQVSEGGTADLGRDEEAKEGTVEDEKTKSICSPSCWKHGTCNEELGRCDCPVGKSGASCQDKAMPACHLAPDYFTPCPIPSTCACARECFENLIPTNWHCYNETKEDGTVETDLEKIFDGPQSLIVLKGMEGGGPPALMPVPREEAHGDQWTTPASCPNKCSGRGLCNRKTRECRCGWTHRGIDCSEMGGAPLNCLNRCSEKGTCIDGFCKCDRGFFGMDCSLFINENGTTKIVPRPLFLWSSAVPAPHKDQEPLHPRIYIYDLPPSFTVWTFVHSDGLDWTEALIFLERVLSSSHRTANPDEADFFYIPLLIRNRATVKDIYVRGALKYIQKTWPRQWERNNGKDHLIITNDDWGNCEFATPGFFNPTLKDVTTITLWGTTRNMVLESTDPCFRLGRDIVAPPVFSFNTIRIPSLENSGKEGIVPRTILMYFIGFLGGLINNAGYKWSFGVRERIYELFGGKDEETGMYIRKTGDPDIMPFMDGMTKSIFCLAPSGFGFGVRGIEAVIMGCIPVVIQPGVVQPLEGDLVNWNAFSVVLSYEEIPNLVTILRSISQEEIERKRKNCQEVWPRFVWASASISPFQSAPQTILDRWAPIFAEKDAFASIMAVLKKRMEAKGSILPIKFGTSLKTETLQTSSTPLLYENLDLTSVRNCRGGCGNKGTCNEEIGECNCVPDYGGVNCREYLMPRCHYDGGDAHIPCVFPSSCGCALDCDKYAFVRPGICFDEILQNGTIETNVSAIFAGEVSHTRLEADGSEFRVKAERDGRYSEYKSPRECHLSCSGRGACNKDRICECVWGFFGAGCEVQNPDHICYNDCSDNGDCVAGTCDCDDGFYGIDCSLTMGSEGRSRVIPSSPLKWSSLPVSPPDPSISPQIYVYELPGYMNTWQQAQSDGLDWWEPVIFLERLLASPYRTTDSEKADYFYIPLMIRNRGGYKESLVVLALNYIKRTWPFWNATGGKDHIILTNDDWGNCEIGPWGERDPYLDNVVTLTLWGHTKNMKLKDSKECFRKGIDVVMPPVMDPLVYKGIPALKQSLRAHLLKKGANPEEMKSVEFPKRKWLLYFRGYPAFDHKATPENPFRWSFGVRQEMFERYEGKENQTGILLERMDVGGVSFLKQMETSEFCLGPSGFGWGMRATQVAMLECIPVVIQPNVVQPLEGDLLDWNDFGVVLTMEDIPRIEKVLRAIPEKERVKKRNACRQIWPRFTWTSGSHNPLQVYPKEVQDQWAPILSKKDAFASIMTALARRLPKTANR